MGKSRGDESSVALSTYIRAQADVIDPGFRDLREDPTPELVHDVRVATRRLRTALKSFSSALDPDDPALEEIDQDLRWLGGLLSELRDTDVLRRNLEERLAELPPELVMGPVREEIAVTLGEHREAAVAELVSQQDTERYRITLSSVSSWRESPPLADDAEQRLERKGKKVLAKRRRKARRRLEAAALDPGRTHAARKSVKRLRYTAEVLAPARPKAKKIAKRAKRTQRSLGHHQDAVVEAEFLRGQARRFGSRSGHNGFVYGVLMAEAEMRASEVREAVLPL
jgi:CHAD domain-containing protein